MLRSPRFWWRERPSTGVFALAVISLLYRSIAAGVRFFKKPVACTAPVISVGNVVVGGAGKTPVALSLVDLLRSMGQNPMVLTRGYGGKLQGPLWVNPEQQDYHAVGDEALLLAARAPTLVAKNRKRALKLIEESPYDVVLLDDGHQQCEIAVDCALLVVDVQQKWGNNWVMPSGPLRERLSSALARTDAVVAMGGVIGALQGTPKPQFQTALALQTDLAPGTKVWGVTGLGYPAKFQKMLRDSHLSLSGFSAFPDHHPFTLKEIERIAEQAAAVGAVLVTTAKDVKRWPKCAPQPVCLTLQLDWLEEKELKIFLKRYVGRKA